MTRVSRKKIMGTTALCILGLGGMPASAQESGDGFLGTIELGSKREVRTDTATSVTEIDETEIKDRQAGTVAELIDSVPGVELINGATSQGSGINIRGFGANDTFGTDQKVLIQVDGVTRGSEELYRIGNQLFTDPALYKEVEVIRGTVGSFEYGSGVVGGVVRLETKDASDFTGGEPGFAFRQILEFQTNGDGMTHSSILAWQPSEKLEFLLNYTQREVGVQKDGNGALINPAAGGIDDPSWAFKGKYTFGQDDAHSVTAGYTSTRSSQYNVPYDSFGMGVGFGNVDRFVESETAMMRYGFNPSGNDLVDLTFQISYADEKIDQNTVLPFPTNPLLDADHQYETTTYTLRNRMLFATGAVDHNLIAGVEYTNRKRKDASSAPGGEDDRWAVFAVNEMSIGDAWTITPALRYEMSDIQGSTAPNNGSVSHDVLMGGLSVRYAFQNGISIFGSAAYTEVLAPIDDLDNPARLAQTEKSRTYEFGAAFERQSVFRDGDDLSFKATYYDTELRDITSFVTNTAPFGPPVFVPLDKISTQGIELEASYAMANGLYADLNANFADGKETTGTLATLDWRNQAANSLRLTVGKKFNDALDLSWEVVAADSITINGVRDSGYVAHNLRATIAPQGSVWQDTEFRIGIENVFDEQYQSNLSTRPAVGRNFKLTLAKTF